MSNGIAVSSIIVDDISQGLGSVDISNNDSLLAAAVSDMSSSRAEDLNSEKKCTSCRDQNENTKTYDIIRYYGNN